MKKVSIIVPTYKRNEFITRALESIIEQDYENKEIIVIDDNGLGTPEQINTEIKLKKYIKNKLIKYICNEENIGGSLSRNKGIEASEGYFITFLDDDDVYLQGKIRSQVNFMEENDLDLCVMDGETYNKNNNLISHKIQPISNEMSQTDILKAHLVKHITGTNVFMYKRESLINIGMFDDIPAGQEFMLMLKSILNNLKIGCIHEVLVHFHMDGQQRISTSMKKINGLKMIYKEKRKYFSLLNNDEISYIKSKHYGTLFYMYYSNGYYFKSIIELTKAFFISPKYTWETYKERKGKLNFSIKNK